MTSRSDPAKRAAKAAAKPAPKTKADLTRLPAQNSKETAKKSRGRPFQKGQSGNPGGRPAVPEHVREACRALTDKAVETLRKVMDDNGAPAAARVSAANSVLDRAWGRPESDVRVGGLPGAPPICTAPIDFSKITPQQAYEYMILGNELPPEALVKLKGEEQ